MGSEILGFHQFISLFSRLVFSSFIMYMGIFNIYCEGGGNKAQKRVLYLGGKERLSESMSWSKFGLIKRG